MNEPTGDKLGDYVRPFHIEGLGVRGRMARLGPAFTRAVQDHDYPADVAALVGETLVLTTVLASGLKYDGVFSLQVQGDGPVGTIVADLTSEGGLRAYAKVDDDALATATGGGPVQRLLGAGHMAFTVDQGPDTERYQGLTELTGATLADCAHHYFQQSEQLETAIVITADAEAGGAAALMVQRLPDDGPLDDEDDAWRKAVVLLSSVTPEELLDTALTPEVLLHRLYHSDDVRLYAPRLLEHACRCSEARVARTLKSFPRDAIDDMVVDGRVEVTCEFCKAEYAYDAVALDALFTNTG